MNNITQILTSSVSNADMSPAAWAALIIGIFGAILIGIYVMPQCVKTIKTKNTASISLGMFVLGALGAFFFVISAIINAAMGNPIQAWLPMLIGNTLSCASSVIVLVFKVRNLKWSKKFQIKEDQIPNHFQDIKTSLAKAKADKKAAKKAQKESQQIQDIKKETPVKTDSGTIIG